MYGTTGPEVEFVINPKLSPTEMSVDPTVPAGLFQALAASAPEGIVICDARSGEWQVVYANSAMEHLTGYEAAALRGRNLRFLQAEDHDQEGLVRIRAALQEGSACTTVLRNYRRDGTMFWNEVTLVPLRDPEGRVTHFASFHREGGDRLRLDPKDARDPSMKKKTMLWYLRDDKLTGLVR